MARAKWKFWASDEGRKKIAELAVLRTDAELADTIGITRTTLYKWFSQHPEIMKAVGEARESDEAERANEAVEAALYQKCLGYNVPLKKAVKLRRAEYDQATGRKIRETEELVEAVEEMHVPADTAAQRFWLTNRDSDRWKNKQELEGAVTVGAEAYFRELAATGGDEF